MYEAADSAAVAIKFESWSELDRTTFPAPTPFWAHFSPNGRVT